MHEKEKDVDSAIHAALRHPIRRNILTLLSRRERTFTEILKILRIESSHLTYHLESLGDLISKSEDGRYKLSELGETAVSMMSNAVRPHKRNIFFISAILVSIFIGIFAEVDSWFLLYCNERFGGSAPCMMYKSVLNIFIFILNPAFIFIFFYILGKKTNLRVEFRSIIRSLLLGGLLGGYLGRFIGISIMNSLIDLGMSNIAFTIIRTPNILLSTFNLFYLSFGGLALGYFKKQETTEIFEPS